MFYEVTCTRTQINERGNDKEVKERFIVENAVFFAEAECKVLDYYNSQCEVVAIKQSNIKEFVNEDNGENNEIYLSTIVTLFVDDNGNEKEQKYVVGVFANSIEDATNKTNYYMKQGLDDFFLVGVKKTNFETIL